MCATTFGTILLFYNSQLLLQFFFLFSSHIFKVFKGNGPGQQENGERSTNSSNHIMLACPFFIKSV